MMKLFFILVFVSLKAFAGEGVDIFFENFVYKELQGNRLQREDHVAIDVKQYSCITDAGNLVSSEFDMDVDSFYLVSDLKILNKNITAVNASFDVSFSVVGEMYYPCATRVIDGKARQFKPHKETMSVKYQLKKEKNTWLLVNPPKPFVNCSAYKEFLGGELKTLEKLLESNRKDFFLPSYQLREAERVFLNEVCQKQ